MFRQSLVALSAFVTLFACAKTVQSTIPFNPEEAAFISRNGNGSISGQAFLRQMGGGVVTCAGESVLLFPATPYSIELFTQIFGNSEGGRLPSIMVVSPDSFDPRFLAVRREAACDAEGDFEFNGLAGGDYYVVTSVQWMVPGSYIPEGGTLGARVKLAPGQEGRVLLN